MSEFAFWLVFGWLCLQTGLVLHADVGNRGAWGDQGDGTYKNPILPGDFSDPDVIRVGADYYLITSTFQFSPGMAILHSKDLVNWQYLGHCVPDLSQIGPMLNWDQMARYNEGIYAGSLRYQNGKFWLFFTTLAEGVFMTSATSPSGPWAPVHLVAKMGGCDDPCPFWDDDGQAYLVITHIGSGWMTHLFKMSADGMTIDPKSDFVVDSFHTSEGNKLYKINDEYYFFHNEVHQSPPGEGRVGVMLRSKNIYGPYEKRVILHNRPNIYEREPNQGGLVDTPDHRWYFITQQGKGADGTYDGRPSHLLPVSWVEGWPIPGDIDKNGIGTITWSAPKPFPESPVVVPQTSSEFDGPALDPQWEWNFQPRADMWSLTDRPGFLRLKAFPPIANYDYTKHKRTPLGAFFIAGNTLAERLMGTEGGEVVTKLDVSQMADGEVAGLCFFWGKYANLSVVQNGNIKTVQLDNNQTITPGPALNGDWIWLKAEIDDKGVCKFAFSLDGTLYNPIGDSFTCGWGCYRGVRLGLCNYNPRGEAGYVDVDFFHYSFVGPRQLK